MNNIAIVTLLRESKAEQWLESFLSLSEQLRSGCSLRLAISDSFSESGIDLILSQLKKTFPFLPVYVKRNPDFIKTGEETGKERTDFILSILNRELFAIKKEVTCILDDDITIPENALTDLYETLNRKDETKGAVSVYNLREDESLAFLHIGFWGMFPNIDEIKKSEFDVFGGGSGFSLWDTESLRKALPIRRPMELIVNWDPYLALFFEERGWKITCNGNVRCYHG